MRGLVDLLLVGSVVLAAVLYAFRALAPRAWRARLGQRLATRGWPRFADWLAPGGAAAAGSCGGCDNCGSTATATTGTSTSATTPTTGGGAETRVPLATIGRRRH